MFCQVSFLYPVLNFISYVTRPEHLLKNIRTFKSSLAFHIMWSKSLFLCKSHIYHKSLLCSPPPAGCATSFQVTVVTSTSWSVIVTAASTNITESGAPMLSPSRCSRCVESSNETRGLLSQPLTLYLLHLLLLFLPSPSHSSTFGCFTIKMFTALLFSSVAKWK